MTDEQLEKVAWLNRAFHAEKKVRALGSLLERDKERAEDISANYDKNDKGKSDSRTNGIEEILLLLAESEEKHAKALREYVGYRSEIRKSLEELHDDELEALFTLRYLNYQTMDEIAFEMGYDKRSIQRKHKLGLEKLSPFVIVCHPLTVI